VPDAEILRQMFLFISSIRIMEEGPVIRQADDSGLSDKVLPKMLKTYCNPIEILFIYMGIQ